MHIKKGIAFTHYRLKVEITFGMKIYPNFKPIHCQIIAAAMYKKS